MTRAKPWAFFQCLWRVALPSLSPSNDRTLSYCEFGGCKIESLFLHSFLSHLRSTPCPCCLDPFSPSPVPSLSCPDIQVHNRNLCTYCCLAGEQWQSYTWVPPSSATFLKLWEAGLSKGTFPPTSWFYLPVAQPWTKWLLYSFRALSKMLPFCLFI